MMQWFHSDSPKKLDIALLRTSRRITALRRCSGATAQSALCPRPSWRLHTSGAAARRLHPGCCHWIADIGIMWPHQSMKRLVYNPIWPDFTHVYEHSPDSSPVYPYISMGWFFQENLQETNGLPYEKTPMVSCKLSTNPVVFQGPLGITSSPTFPNVPRSPRVGRWDEWLVNAEFLLVGGLVAIFGIFPLILGRIIIPIDGPYFSEGWPNHQPDWDIQRIVWEYIILVNIV